MSVKPNPLIVVLTVSALLLGAAGCGKSKEQLALERMQNRKKPGLVRLVNLTDKPLTIFWQGRDMDTDIASGTYNRLRNIGHGKQEVVIGSGTAEYAKVPLEVGEREITTVIAYGTAPNIKTTVLKGEFEYPTSSRNIQVFFVGEDGKPATGSVTLNAGTAKFDFTDRAGGEMLPAGTYAVEGAGLKTALGGEVTNENTYTLLVFKRATGDADALLLRNTYIEKPVMAGAN